MTTAQELAMAVLDVLQSGDTDRLDHLVSEDFVDHGVPPWMPTGRTAYAQTFTFLHHVLQLRYEVHRVVAEGDYVAIHATAHGVDNSGHLGFPATGKPYAMPTMHLYREQDGMLVEHWGVRDELQALWQVGALPTPAPPAAFAELAGR
ncbi:MAG: ester cyclase [Tetrasphaera sp.]